MSPHREAQLGSLVAAGGIVWIAAIATNQVAAVSGMLLPSGPMEICTVGILIWLHAKWRGSVRRV